MCGICGFTRVAPDAEAGAVLDSMTASLAHRGPDGRGTWIDPDHRSALGHTRLSIIDLSGGAQPMSTADGRYVVVFNGELYNFQELRGELQRAGCAFRTRSDTEVLLSAYATWGLEALPRLEGMFAFAIFDTRDGSLVLARDRVGIKPLYYCHGPQGFAFGSEIKAIFRVPGLPRRLDYEALVDYLVLGYPLAPKTFFRDVRELEPGAWLKISSRGFEQGSYWTWHRAEADWSEPEALARAGDALVETLRLHLLADVPVGALLSGGVDSSLLVSLLARELKADITAFTVRFQEAAYDESPYARMVSGRLGIPHREIEVAGGTASLEEVHQIMDQFDQPFADSSAIPTYLVSREIRRHVKVVIGGDGGDEMFGGYVRFRYADVARRLGRVPAPLLAGGRGLCRGAGWLVPALSRRCGRMLKAAGASGSRRLLNLSCYNDPDELTAVLSPGAQREAGGYLPVLSADGAPETSWDGRQMIDAAVRQTLPGDYLRKVDVMSSAHGLEVRVPYLGDRILDLAARLPHRLKYDNSRNAKKLLRQLLLRYVPREVFDRPKWGFGIPIDTYFSAESREAIRAAVLDPGSRMTELLSREHMEPLLAGFVHGDFNRSRWSRYAVYQNAYLLWGLSRWLQQWEPSL
jgi:asparagine synthase (glutamine-hydrolysing)